MSEAKMAKALIILIVAFISTLGLTMFCFIFSFLNQSSFTPPEKQLTFVNYLVPFLLTISFIITYVVDKFLVSQLKKKTIVIRIILVILGAILAIPWQAEQITWQLKKNMPDFFFLACFLIAAFYTLSVVYNSYVQARKGIFISTLNQN